MSRNLFKSSVLQKLLKTGSLGFGGLAALVVLSAILALFVFLAIWSPVPPAGEVVIELDASTWRN